MSSVKKLKFRHHLVPLILDGTKTSTWRLFDDKNLKTGDELEFFDYDTKEKFANAKITGITEKRLGEMTKNDFKMRERYQNTESMLNHYKNYYGNNVTLDTAVKIIDFKLVRVREKI